MKNSVDMNATSVLTELDEQELKSVNGGCLGGGYGAACGLGYQVDPCATGYAAGCQVDPCATGYGFGYQVDPCATGYAFGFGGFGGFGWHGRHRRWGSRGILRAGIGIL